MNRTVYQPYTSCGCRRAVPYPGGAAQMQTHHTEKPVSCRADTEQQNTGMNGCTPEQDGVLAMAYVHVQSFGTLYDPCTALIAGTVFPSLDKPFCGDTVSASAYPNPPARTCDCALPTHRDSGCCGTRGGHGHD